MLQARLKVPNICNVSVSESQITLHLLYDQHFWVTGHFETSIVNDPHITYQMQQDKNYTISVLLVSLSPKFQPVLPAFFFFFNLDLAATLSQAHLMSP